MKTNVDNIMLEMIQPKMIEIETKFSNGQPLEQTDINTLLLKSQFNHINHLDLKLDEVTDSVIHLKNDFLGLENKFQGLENKVDNKISSLENKFQRLENKVDKRMSSLENKFQGLENKLNVFMEKVDGRFNTFEIKIKESVNQTIITNMKFTLGTIALIATAFKVADLIFK